MDRRIFFISVWNGRVRPVLFWAVLLLSCILLVNIDFNSLRSFEVNWIAIGKLILICWPVIAIVFFLALVSYVIQEFVPASYKRVVRVCLRVAGISIQLAIFSWAYYKFYQERNYTMIILMTVLLGVGLFKKYQKKKAGPDNSSTII